jgi:hypothetical protein
VRDHDDEALQRAQEIYQRLTREMRADLERTMRRPSQAQQGSPARPADPALDRSA